MNYNSFIDLCNDVEKQLILIKDMNNKALNKVEKKYKIIKITLVIFMIIFCVFFVFFSNYLLFEVLGLNTVEKKVNVSTNIVYITDTGDCYHSSDCSWLFSSTEVTIEYAMIKGYRKCSKCHPGFQNVVYFSKESNYEASIIISLIISFIIYLIIWFKIDGKNYDSIVLLNNIYKENKCKVLSSIDEYLNFENIKKICGVPDDIELDNNFLPNGEEYYCYVSKNGQKYHSLSNCGGYFLNKLHIFKTEGYTKCKKCGKDITIPKWYYNYLELKSIIKRIEDI